MKALRGCVLWLALYAGIAMAVRFAVERRIGAPEPAIAVGLIGGFFLWLGVTYLAKVIRLFGEARLIWRASSGAAEPSDGARFVAIGPMMPIGRTLASPISRSAAVAYSYSIMSPDGDRWAGVAITPSMIRAGAQSIKVLAQPVLDFKPERLAGDSAASHAAEYIRSTKFVPRGEAAVAHDGAFRQDIGTSNQTASLSRGLITEAVIRPGEEVCVFGRYRADRNALVGDSVGDDKVRILKAAPGSLLTDRAFGVVSNLVAAAVTVAIVFTALTALYALIPLDVVARPSWPEIRFESLLDERVRPKLASYASMLPRSLEVGETLEAGQARGRIRTATGETVIDGASARRIGETIEITLLASSTPVATLTLTNNGALTSLIVAGTPVQVPEGKFVARVITPEELAARISHPLGGIHAAFRVRVPKV